MEMLSDQVVEENNHHVSVTNNNILRGRGCCLRRCIRSHSSSSPFMIALKVLILVATIVDLVRYDTLSISFLDTTGNNNNNNNNNENRRHNFYTVWGLTSVSIILPRSHSPNPNKISSSYSSNPNCFHVLRSSSLSATMYLPDDWVDDQDHDESDVDGNTATMSTSGSLTIPSILQSPEWVAPLARIAAEYTKRLTPTIGQIQVQQIEHVSITNVAPSHVDIEAVVCENEACVSLSVPVPFTEPCLPTTTVTSSLPTAPSPIASQSQPQPPRDKSFEDCVIRNIQELDTIQLQQQATVAPTTASSPNNNNIVDGSQVEYPSWWVPLGPSLELARECQSLLQVLNEAEFQREITILVTKELYRMLNMEYDHGTNTSLQVQSAVAVALGPKGMIFRVMALYEQQLEMVDVPIPFSSHGLLSIRDVNDPMSLRNAVLYCIENVVP